PPPVPPEVAASQDPWPDAESGPEPEPEPEPDAEPGAAGPEAPEGQPAEEPEAPTAPLLARVAADRLEGLARGAQHGIMVLGGMVLILAVLLSPGPRTQREVLIGLVGFGLVVLAGLAAGLVLRGFSALLLVQADQAEAAGRVERHFAEGLERLAAA